MIYKIIFLSKSDLDNYIGKYEYYKNYRNEKYDKELQDNLFIEINFIY